MDGKTYQLNQNFINEACSGQCKCYGWNRVACVSLCPPQYAVCSPDQTSIEEPVLVSKEPKCHCLRNKCVPNGKKMCLSSCFVPLN